MKKSKISNKSLVLIMLGCIFLLMLILNYLTPLIADDFSYSFGLDGRIKDFVDIVQNQFHHYFNWGGRVVAHFIGQTFLMFPKIIFSILNAAMYTLLVWLIYANAKGSHDDNPKMIIIINLALWFVLPVFGQTCLWLIGSCNYLWTMVIILAFSLVYRKNVIKDSIFSIMGLLLLGIIAGWTNENTSFGLIVLIFGLLLFAKRNGEKLKKWQISGFIGSVVGFITLIIAPGNFIRSEEFVDDTFILIKFLKRGLDYTASMVDILLPLIIVTVILISLIIYYKKKINNNIYPFIAASIFAVYSMIASPYFPERAWFGVVVFMLISVMILLFDVDELMFKKKAYNTIIGVVIAILAIMYFGDYCRSTLDIYNFNNVWDKRIAYIEREKVNNNYDVVVSKYDTGNSKNPAYGLGDLTTNPDTWPNEAVSRYFGLKSIKIAE